MLIIYPHLDIKGFSIYAVKLNTADCVSRSPFKSQHWHYCTVLLYVKLYTALTVSSSCPLNVAARWPLLLPPSFTPHLLFCLSGFSSLPIVLFPEIQSWFLSPLAVCVFVCLFPRLVEGVIDRIKEAITCHLLSWPRMIKLHQPQINSGMCQMFLFRAAL